MNGQNVWIYGNYLTESPYPHSTVQVMFGDDSFYWISVHLLDRYPKFRLSYDTYRGVVKLNWLNETQTDAFVRYLHNGKWQRRRPEGLDGLPEFYNGMQHCLSVHGLALEYEMDELVTLSFEDFIKMADRYSIFELMKMLKDADWTLHSNQTALADYFTQRVAMSEETITEDQITIFRSGNSARRTFANIALVGMIEMKHKLQQYEEEYGPLENGEDSVKTERVLGVRQISTCNLCFFTALQRLSINLARRVKSGGAPFQVERDKFGDGN